MSTDFSQKIDDISRSMMYPDAPDALTSGVDSERLAAKNGGLTDDLLKAVRNELLSHETRTRELLRAFQPKRTDQVYAFDGSQYTGPRPFNLPKDTLGGIYVENNTTSTAYLYLGSRAFDEAYFDVPPGAYKALPINEWQNAHQVTLTLDNVSAGRVRLLLSSEPLGPSEGTLVITSQAGGSVNGTIVNVAPATPANNYVSGNLGSTLKNLTLFLSVSGATIVNIDVSPDNVNWYPATIPSNGAPAATNFSGAAAEAILITPAPYVRVRSSNAVNLLVQYAGS